MNINEQGLKQLNEKWKKVIEQVVYAYQPIVNCYTGVIFGVEALLRNIDKTPFDSINQLFDDAYREGVLYFVDIELRKKAIEGFTKISIHQSIKLFYNYDPRILEMKDYKSGITEEILQTNNLSQDSICFEINEKYQISCIDTLKNFVQSAKNRGIQIALDDFGSGFAGFELFYHSEPNIIKFDRFLIQDIHNDIKKRTFCSYIVNLCKILGIITLAEGIETDKEAYCCQELNFDLVQGFYIGKPVIDTELIVYLYETIKCLNKRKKESTEVSITHIENEILTLDTVSVNDDMISVLDKFKKNIQNHFFPVVDSSGYPLGIIHESRLKKYLLIPFGRELLINKSISNNIIQFIDKCPIIDLLTPQDKIIEIFVNNIESEGVIITKNLTYYGFLDAKSLLSIINEANLTYARETNPLTKLPGNQLIHKKLTSIDPKKNDTVIIYFDFDNFKPFNDKYGFRQGDRAILLFSELLNKHFSHKNTFVGHIGGDDFIAIISGEKVALKDAISKVKLINEKFSDDLSSFYSSEDRKRGYYTSVNRNGEIQNFEFLTVSAAVISVLNGDYEFSPDFISSKLTNLKKKAKASKSRIACKEMSYQKSSKNLSFTKINIR